MTTETLLLKRSEVAALITLEECINAVENAFKMYAEGEAMSPAILGIHARDGGFHIKAGILDLKRSYFVAKTNANFPLNPKQNGLPTIQGVISISDAENGRLLALMDSIEITILRTGAATAVAAKCLSKKESRTATIIGCGNQGIISAKMLMQVRPLKTIFAHDIDKQTAEEFAISLSKELKINILPVDDVASAVMQSDICVTCTTSRQPVLKYEHIPPGIFIAAVGCDSEDKQELDGAILKRGKLVTDLVDQCAKIGELHHAIEQNIMIRKDVYAELGQIIANKKPGRVAQDEVIVFDSTGTALQDVASAAIVFEKAEKDPSIVRVSFSE